MTDTQAPSPTLNRAQRRKLKRLQRGRSKATHRNKLLPKQEAKHCATIYRAMALNQRYTEAEQAHMILPAWSAFDNIRTGKGTKDDLDTIAVIINACMVLSADVHPDCQAVARQAAQACIAVKVRYRKTGRIIFSNLTTPEMDNLQAGIELYEEFLRHIKPSENINALNVVRASIGTGNFLEDA